MTFTAEDAEVARQDAINEPGSEPPCPFCKRPRVRRSDYIRCNGCATNWLDGEDITRDPRIERRAKFMASFAAKSKGEANAG